MAAFADGAAVLPGVLASDGAAAAAPKGDAIEITKGGFPMMFAAIASCTALAVVAFSIGFVCGKDAGRQQAEALARSTLLKMRAASRRDVRTPSRDVGVFSSNRATRETAIGSRR